MSRAARPEVGSSKKISLGFMMSSIPTQVRLDHAGCKKIGNVWRISFKDLSRIIQHSQRHFHCRFTHPPQISQNPFPLPLQPKSETLSSRPPPGQARDFFSPPETPLDHVVAWAVRFAGWVQELRIPLWAWWSWWSLVLSLFGIYACTMGSGLRRSCRLRLLGWSVAGLSLSRAGRLKQAPFNHERRSGRCRCRRI